MMPIGALSFAALDGQHNFIGLLQSWPVALADSAGREHPLIMVGPVAVLPAVQQGGVGKKLMQKLMDEARAHKCEPLMMIGYPEYYDRFFGFSAAATFGWECPGQVERHRLLAKSVDGRELPGQGKLGLRYEMNIVTFSNTHNERSPASK